MNDGSGAFSGGGQTLNCAIPGLSDLDGDGDLDTFSAHGGISPYPNEVWFNENPIVGLVAGNDGPTELDGVTILSATVTSGTNISYIWEFGDGITATGQVVTHVYTSTGTYTATVTATNAAGSSMATTAVTVVEFTSIFLPVMMKPEM